MNSSKTASLKCILSSLERERNSLKHALLSGKISHETFDLLEKRISRIASLALELEEFLKEEESFWEKNLVDGIRIFESLLVELEHKRLLGMIGEYEYQRNTEIINEGLKSIMEQMRRDEKPKMSIEASPEELEEDLSQRKFEEKKEMSPPRQSENSVRRNRVNNKAGIESQSVSEVHCMNPWKPDCKNTDIEVSIYYNGRMVPICRECWEEIANKDVEWSSL
ncbi:hypothetical protein CW705_01020 [Candidatus Bathyarchaeota archaeon]|nr:MAG: hypothetical protein CW705_01020 [Candidatus Bathyarchaeota archaeon]